MKKAGAHFKNRLLLLETREREGILCPGVLHVSHRISHGVCGSLGMDTRAVMDYDRGSLQPRLRYCGYT